MKYYHEWSKKLVKPLQNSRKKVDMAHFSILYWFRQNREKFINTTKKWIDVVLSDKPELEDPNVVYIETDIHPSQNTQVWNMWSVSVVLSINK